MKKYTLKKLGKKLLPVALGTLALATASEAQAEETSNTSSQAATKSESAGLVAEENLTTAKANLDSATKKANEQATLVETSKNNLDKTNKEVATSKELLAEAEKLKAEASPEKISETSQQVKNLEAEKTSKTSALDKATTTQKTKENNLANHEAEVTELQKILASKKAELDLATKNLATAQNSLNSSNIDALKKEVENAKANLANAETKLAEASKKLEEAKKVDSDKAAAVANSKNFLDLAIQEEKKAKEEVDKAQEGYDNIISDKIITTSNVDTQNRIIISNDIKNYLLKTKNSIPFLSYDEHVKLAKETEVLRDAEYKKNLDSFKPVNFYGDTKFDIYNLPDDVRRDLSIFTKDLINDIRRQMGISDVQDSQVTNFSLTMAKRYEENPTPPTPEMIKEAMENPGSEAAKEYYYSRIYFYLGDVIGLEGSGSRWVTKIQAKEVMTYNELANLIYKLVARGTYGGEGRTLNNLLSEHTGYSTSSRENHAIYHPSYGGKFDLALAISKSAMYEGTINISLVNASEGEKQVILDEFNPLENIAAPLKSTLDSKKATYTNAKAKLDQAQADYNKIVSSNSLTASAQKEFDTAKVTKEEAEKKLASAQKSLDSASLDSSKKAEIINKAKADLTKAQEDFNQAKENIAKAEKRVADLRVELESLKLLVATANAEYTNSNSQLAKATSYLNNLSNVDQILKERKEKLEKLLLDLEKVQAEYTKEKENFDKLDNLQKEANEIYTKLLADYTIQKDLIIKSENEVFTAVPVVAPVKEELPTLEISQSSLGNKTTSITPTEDSKIVKNSKKKKTTSTNKLLPKTSATTNVNNSLTGLATLGLLAGLTLGRRKKQ